MKDDLEKISDAIRVLTILFCIISGVLIGVLIVKL